jgi:membrane associated rhomboid family serine protease
MANKNGHDDDDGDKTGGDQQDPKIMYFPEARERAELERRLRVANDAEPKAPYEPILNLPPAVKILSAILLLIQAAIWLLSGGELGDLHMSLGVFKNEELANTIFMNFAFFVLRYTGGMPFGWQGLASPVTHMFLHGGWLHAGINVATLAAFGAGLERELGWRKLLVLYFVSGVFGAFTHLVLYFCYVVLGAAASFPAAGAPLVGASGGISGLFGAVLLMMQDNQGGSGDGRGDFRRLLPIVALWIGISLFFGMFGMPGQNNPIAWTVHIGGFVAGLLLYRPVLRYKSGRSKINQR